MKERGSLFRELSFDSNSIDKENRTAELSFSSETPYRRWFGQEILSHSVDSIDLTRLSEIGVLLFNHDSNMPIGKVEAVHIDDITRKCKATVRFDDDDASDKIFQKVLSGTLKGVSVGYRVDVWEEVESGSVSTDGRFSGPCSIATRWTPHEISIVSVPADYTVGVGRGLENTKIKGEEKMDDEKNTEDLVKKALEDERQRVSDIVSICSHFDIPADEYIKSGDSSDSIRKIVLDKLANERKNTSVITVIADETDKFRYAAIDGLAMRAGITIEKPADGANQFSHKNILRLAQECVERQGITRADFSDEELIRSALQSGSAFPGILSAVANKSMAQSYQGAATTFQYWASKGSNSDFKGATRYRVSEADELEKISEQGEFVAGTNSETSVTTKIATYGKTFGFSRQALINDDLSALNQIPSLYGAAARRMVNKMVYKILMDNQVFEKVTLFHAEHGNLGAGALSVASLGKAKAAMAKQKNIGGKEFLNIQPAYLIVPVDLEVDAAQLIGSVVDPSKSNATLNPFANKLSVVAEPELSESKSWYLAAAPGLYPCVEVTYLNGKEMPTMEQAIQFDTLGVKWRIFFDVGVNLIDYRGLFKSTGV